MKLALDRSVLLKSLAHMQSVAERRNTVEILFIIRIEAMGDAVSLHATDMDLEGYRRVPALVTEEGVTTVPAHTLFEIVKSFLMEAKLRFRITTTIHKSVFDLAVLVSLSHASPLRISQLWIDVMTPGGLGGFKVTRTCFGSQQPVCVRSLTGPASLCQQMKHAVT